METGIYINFIILSCRQENQESRLEGEGLQAFDTPECAQLKIQQHQQSRLEGEGLQAFDTSKSAQLKIQ